MTPERLVTDLAATLLLATLAGLGWNGRLRSCLSFTAFLAVALTTNRLVTWWPDEFYRGWFWIRKECALAALQALVAFELATLLTAWPRARRIAMAAIMAVAGLATLATVVGASDDYYTNVGVMVARAHAGADWAFAVLAAVVAWYHLPLQPLHRMILIAFVLQLTAFGGMLGLIGWLGWSSNPYADAIERIVFASTAGLWVMAAWSPRPLPAALPVRALR